MADIQITDQTFDETVLKSAKPVLVDFWAVWCVSPETYIYSTAYQATRARLVASGDKLVGLDKKVSHGTVSYSQTTTDGGHCKKLVTESGRAIELTNDHLIFTSRGWIPAEQVVVGDSVAILPVREPIEFRGSDAVVIDHTVIEAVAGEKMKILSYVADLKSKGLLPFAENNIHVLTIARLVGALFSDGCLYQGKNNYREISFVVGTKQDAERVATDLRSLGVAKLHVQKRCTTGQIGKRTIVQHSHRVKCLSTAFYLLFRALGVPEGKKLAQVYHVPPWIFNGHKAIKREFLAAILGGDGPKVSLRVSERKNKLPYNSLSINDFEFHKRDDLTSGGLAWARELSLLFEEFGVSIKRIWADTDIYKRRDGIQTRTIHLRFANNFATGYALAQNIGYYYSKTKEESASVNGEFLRIILEKRRSWQEFYQRVHALYQQERSVKYIAEKLHLGYNTILGWTKLGKKATIAYHHLKFPTWFQSVTKGLAHGLLWQEIATMQTVYLPAVQRIQVAPTHNFVANGFLVHNCGPCQMQGPIVEEVAKEMEGKAVVGKVNVDESPQSSSKYGVMSIPTLIIFKGGQPVKQMVGVQSKETLVSALNAVI